MDDSTVLSRIEALVAEEYDLLRQRRARREAGEDLDGAQVRDSERQVG